MKRNLTLIFGIATIFGAITACNKNLNNPMGGSSFASTGLDTTGSDSSKNLTDSLWAYFPINGNLGDSSGHGHALNLYGAFLTTDSLGHANGALDFNDSTDTAYALIPDGKTFTSNTYSISFFIEPRITSGVAFTKVNRANGNGAAMLLGVDPRAHNFATVYAAVPYASDSIVCSTGGGAGSDALGPQWVVSHWTHFVATWSAGTQKLYINGALVDSMAAPFTVQDYCSNAPFVLGNWWSGDLVPRFDGKMNEIRIYTRAITSAEVAYIYHHYKKL